jgi:SulP family sulfate permease
MAGFRPQFHPRLLDELRDYDAGRFARDLSAGITVAVVALPLAMAFAIASGVKPENGIFTAIIAGLLVSALGGSRVQIGGPAGAFIVIIYGILEKYGLANLLISTVFAGLMLLAMGIFRLGSVIRYIPVPIVIGFTNGIALLIALSQIKDFFGLPIAKMPGDFFAQIQVIALHANQFSLAALALGMLSLLIIFGWPKLMLWVDQRTAATNRVVRVLTALPATVIVLVLATLAVSFLPLQVETIGTRFGGVPQALPTFTIPDFHWELVKQLFPPALTIALLGAIESLLCARVADDIIGDRHDPNQELMAQGIANIVTPFFGGLPATGTIARTVTNIRSGATSPVAGILHSLVLLMIVLLAAPLARNIPLAALAAILLFVAWHMGEWHEFRRMMHFPLPYRVLILATFLLTVVLDLSVAVEVGLALACVFFIMRISGLTRIEAILPEALPSALPPGVTAYSIFGSLFFGAVDKLESLMDYHSLERHVLILDMHQLINVDVTGLHALEGLHSSLEHNGGELILCGATNQPLSMMTRGGFLARMGPENCVTDMAAALARAAEVTGWKPDGQVSAA